MKLLNSNDPLSNKYKELFEEVHKNKEAIMKDNPTNGSLYIFQAMTTIYGFLKIHQNSEQILQKNNDKGMLSNPGAIFMSEQTGLTMHADRNPVTGMIKEAPEVLIKVFDRVKREGKICDFFLNAFSPEDGCFEARYERILNYLQMLGIEDTPANLEKNNNNSFSEVSIDSQQTKDQIIGNLLNIFYDKIVERFLSANGVNCSDFDKQKQDLLSTETFMQQNCREDQFKEFLNEIGILEKKGKDKAEEKNPELFSQDDINRIVSMYTDLEMLYK